MKNCWTLMSVEELEEPSEMLKISVTVQLDRKMTVKIDKTSIFRI